MKLIGDVTKSAYFLISPQLTQIQTINCITHPSAAVAASNCSAFDKQKYKHTHYYTYTYVDYCIHNIITIPQKISRIGLFLCLAGCVFMYTMSTKKSEVCILAIITKNLHQIKKVSSFSKVCVLSFIKLSLLLNFLSSSLPNITLFLTNYFLTSFPKVEHPPYPLNF